jgi:hypothetical protein
MWQAHSGAVSAPNAGAFVVASLRAKWILSKEAKTSAFRWSKQGAAAFYCVYRLHIPIALLWQHDCCQEQ